MYTKNSDRKQEEKLIVYGGAEIIMRMTGPGMEKYILFARDADWWFLTIPEAKSTFFSKRFPFLGTASSRLTGDGWHTRPTKPGSGRFM